MGLSNEDLRLIREHAAKHASAGGAQPTIDWYTVAVGVAVGAWVLLLVFAGAVLTNPRAVSDEIAGFALATGAIAGATQWLRGWLWRRRYDRAYDEERRERMG